MSEPLGMTPKVNSQNRKGTVLRVLDWVEKVGNKLPHPFFLFLFLGLIIIIVSGLTAGIEVTVPGSKDAVVAKSLLTPSTLISIFADLHKNFIAFPPLASVITIMIAVGVAEQSGLFHAALKRTLTRVPRLWVTGAIFLIGICGNLASDAGIVFIPALAGIVFAGIGRNPIIGILAAYAAVNGGFTANLFITTNDAMLTPITEAAARTLPILADYQGSIAMNWYFLLVSTLLLTIVGTWVTERYIAPLFEGEFLSSDVEPDKELTIDELKGLKAALISLIAYIVIVVLLAIPSSSPFRNPETRAILPKSPLMDSLMSLNFFLFLIPGLAYGWKAKTIKNSKDIVSMMGKGIAGLISFLIVAFAAGQFLAWFKMTNLSTIIAVKGADLLKATGLTGAPLIVIFILIITLVNVFVYSSSAKWAMLAPIFIPMFALLGFSPAATQAFYRIGDSCGDIISPIYPYLPIVIGLVQKYKKDTGMGTIMAAMIPYCIAFLIIWAALAVIWILFKIPVGPGANLFL